MLAACHMAGEVARAPEGQGLRKISDAALAGEIWISEDGGGGRVQAEAEARRGRWAARELSSWLGPRRGSVDESRAAAEAAGGRPAAGWWAWSRREEA